MTPLSLVTKKLRQILQRAKWGGGVSIQYSVPQLSKLNITNSITGSYFCFKETKEAD
jgi:hypothetical protein